MRNLFLMNIFTLLLRIIETKILVNKNSTLNELDPYSIYSNKRKLEQVYKIDNIINIQGNDPKISYIDSTTNLNGDIYLTINSENSDILKRTLYIIHSNYSQELVNIVSSHKIHNRYPLITYLNIINKNYIVSINHETQMLELLNYNEATFYDRVSMIFNSSHCKNAMLALKYYNYSNYVISAFLDNNSNFVIQKFFLNIPDLFLYDYNYTEKKLGTGLSNTSVTCFEFSKYIECLYTSSNSLYTVSIFDIENLDNLHNEIIDTRLVQTQELFSKCIHVKDKVGAFVYYTDNALYPYLQFKILKNSVNAYELKDYIDNVNIININDKNAIPFNSHYIYNDLIKSDNNNIYYISTGYWEINMYITLIKLLNNDKNVLLTSYRTKVYDYYKIQIYKDISAFCLNGLLGIALTHYNHDINSETIFSSFFIFGNITSNDEININIAYNINIFNSENQYEFKISEITEKISIKNNIFGYVVKGIKIISDLNKTNLGFYIYSNINKERIQLNELISNNDTITFKLNSEIGVKLGNYLIEYQIIITEPEYEQFISYSDSVEFFPHRGPPNQNSYNDMYKYFFKQTTFQGKTAFFNFSVNECYYKCESCSYYGDDLNNHCDICINNYPFSSIILNGYNCFESCPQNYNTQDNTCIKKENDDTEDSTENIDVTIPESDSEVEKISDGNTYEEITEINSYNENINDNSYEKISVEISSEEIPDTNINSNSNEKVTETASYEEDNSEKVNNNNEDQMTENKNIDFENNCKKLFYIDENLKVNCIEGDYCIDEYPHIDKNIKNMCTNCLFKYKNKCYMECPENTCIKQEINLDTCVDIGENTKVINKICFDNFQDIVSNIKEMSENNEIIENIPNLTLYVYDIEKNESYFEQEKLTYIYFKDIQDILIEEFNLEKNSNIYALIVDSPSKYSNSTINDYGFILLLENGTELDVSKISEDLKVKISIPIIDLELANYDYATTFSQQGYDIYDKNSKFYRDICTPGYLNDDDLTLKDRRNEIFINNITTGKSNCEYTLTDINNKRFIYNCYIADINDNNTNNNVAFSFENEEKQENILNYILDLVNYKVLNCSALFMNIDNFRHNKAVMICTTSIFITVLLFIIFFCSRMPKVRVMMFEEIRNIHRINRLRKRPNKKNRTKITNLSNPIKLAKGSERGKRKNKREILDSNKMLFSLSQDNKKNSDRLKVCDELDKDKQKNKSTKKNDNKINNGRELVEYDNLPFQLALKIDKRNILYIFKLKISEKITIIDICVNKQLKEIALSQYFLYLLIDLTMNAMLYSDNIVSHKKHNNGNIDDIIVILLSGFANILSSIIGYYLNKLVGFEEIFDQIKEIRKEDEFLRIVKIIVREMKIRVVLFFICEIIIILFCTYYMFIFFTIYHKSQMSLLKSYIISILENWFINLLVVVFIVIFRKIGMYYRNIYIYNTSKYLDKNF